jgi:outer membrane protein OmpA-like peptidoglycan-associated protein
MKNWWLGCAIAASALLAGAPAAAQSSPEDEPLPPSFPNTAPPPGGAPPAGATPPPRPPAAPPPPAAVAPLQPPVAPPPAAAEPPLPARPPAAAALDPQETLASGVLEDQPPPRDTSADELLPSLAGPIGLYRMSTADVGPPQHLRLALHGEFFQADNFLVQGDANSRLLGDLTFGFTPIRNLELFGAFLTASNRNRRAFEPDRRDPELIKSFGDLVLGSKGRLQLSPGVDLAGEIGLKFLSSVQDLSFSPSSTSLWFGPVLSFDLRKLTSSATPLRFHVSASYYVDNSAHLHDFTDTSRYTEEVATFAYGIEGSRFRAAVGVDAPLEKLIPEFPLQPFAEYHAEIVTGGANKTFADYMPPACGKSADMPCKDNRDQHWITLGVRARVYKGITLDVGADLALRSVGFPYGTPLPPYNMIFGMSYPLDIEAFRRPVVVTRTVDRPVPVASAAPVEGQVSGIVKSAKGAAPIVNAIVTVSGRPRSKVATDTDGSFTTVGLPPGPAELEVSAPGFESGKVTAAVNLGHAVDVEVTLTPKTPTGNIRGKVADDRGRGLEASLKFLGPDNFEAKSDSTGLFSAALPVGPYKVTAEAPGFPTKEVQLDVVESQDKQMDFVLRNRPPNPDVSLSGDAIALKKPLKFRVGATAVDSKWEPELDGVADLLEGHPEIKTLRVETYWDNSAGPAAKELTQKQADALKAYLVKKGIADGRIEAVGGGADKPLVPNISPANKAKNRRVELHTVK